LLRKDEVALRNLSEAADRGAKVSTTVVSLCELYAGAYASEDPLKELRKVEGLVSTLAILDLTQEASRKYGELLSSQPIRAQPISDFDLLIAAIALSNREPLITRNPEHFGRVAGLSIEQW
jgi:predicted nucleic acid-binding protein